MGSEMCIRDSCDDVLAFMKKTTVKQLMDHWPGIQEIPPNFSKLRAKIDEDPTTYTLYQLDQLRRHLCGGVKLTEVVLVIIGLEKANSFFAVWLIPSALVPLLLVSARKLDLEFYLCEHILKVMVDEKLIFSALPDSKQNIPAPIAASVEKKTLSSLQQQKVHEIRDELSHYMSYSGVGIVCDCESKMFAARLTVHSLKELNYNIVSVDNSVIDFKTVFTTIAQSRAYPKSPVSAGSPPFVIVVFVSGRSGNSSGIFRTRYGPVDIVDDIIKPFLPQSAPHLVHIPKFFFICSIIVDSLSSKSLLLPDDHNGNYLIAHYVTQSTIPPSWLQYVARCLSRRGESVQDTIEESRYAIQEDYKIQVDYGWLHVYSCLEDRLILRK